jgi:hypothetical protein
MKMRKKTIHRVRLACQDHGQWQHFPLAIEGAKDDQAAARKALHIAWKKMGKVLADVRVDSITNETVWY